MSMTSTSTCTCFLKHSPPPTPIPTHPKQVQVVIPRTSEPASLARRCAVGIACAAICLELIGSIQGENLAMAVGDAKWSEKRSCPAWHTNSLETIVPENLPRPSGKRRWETVGLENSPTTVRIRMLRHGNGCFWM